MFPLSAFRFPLSPLPAPSPLKTKNLKLITPPPASLLALSGFSLNRQRACPMLVLLLSHSDEKYLSAHRAAGRVSGYQLQTPARARPARAGSGQGRGHGGCVGGGQGGFRQYRGPVCGLEFSQRRSAEGAAPDVSVSGRLESRRH